MNPAFTASAVRRYKPVFVKVAQSVSNTGELVISCPNVSLQITEQLNNSGALPVDMCPLLSEAALKSISEGS